MSLRNLKRLPEGYNNPFSKLKNHVGKIPEPHPFPKLIIVAVAVAGSAIVLISFVEQFPLNWEEKDFPQNEGNLSGRVTYPASFPVPVRAMNLGGGSFDKIFYIYVNVRNIPQSAHIDRITLSGGYGSPLATEEPEFNTDGQNTYRLPVHAAHSGEIRNSTHNHNVNVAYTMDGIPQLLSIPVAMSVRMMNFNETVYLLIVFIGVLVSRYASKIYNRDISDEGTKKSFDLKSDGMWVFASGIITLLIFSSFQEQVELQSSLLVNISLAFTFGFGFDKLIETATTLTKQTTGK